MESSDASACSGSSNQDPVVFDALTYSVRAEILIGVRSGCDKSKALLIQHNRVVVASRIKKFFFEKDTRLEEDAWQEGCLGLLRAATSYDQGRGCWFSVYASRHVFVAIQKWYEAIRTQIVVPPYRRRQTRRLHALHHELQGNLDRHPSEADMATASGLSVQRVRDHARDKIRYVGAEDCYENEAFCGAPIDVAGTVSSEVLLRWLGQLRPRARSVIKMLYGLEGPPLTIEQTAVKLGYGHTHIGRIRDRAIENLRRIAAAEA